MEEKEKQYSRNDLCPPAANHSADGILLSRKPQGEGVEGMVAKKMQYMPMPTLQHPAPRPQGHVPKGLTSDSHVLQMEDAYSDQGFKADP